MKLPRGELLRSRVVSDLSTTLEDALDRSLTGYAVLEPQDALLLDADGRGVLTFEDGVPMVAYHTGTDAGGPAALADLVVPGPYRVELYDLDADTLASVNETDTFQVPPALPAERLAGDPELAQRTTSAAPSHRLETTPDEEELDAVAAFLEDDGKIEAIKEQARAEAVERAKEWGLTEELAGDSHSG